MVEKRETGGRQIHNEKKEINSEGGVPKSP